MRFWQLNTTLLKGKRIVSNETLIGDSLTDFWRAYSSFVTRVASFAPERNEGANDATRDPIIITTQGQIGQIYFIRNDCFT